MKARSIARELALLGISQLADTSDEARQNKSREYASPGGGINKGDRNSQQLTANQLEALLVKALAALSADVKEALETADGELQRSERLVLESETRTIEADKVRSRIAPAVPLIEAAINRVGGTLEFLVFAQQGEQKSITSTRTALEAAAEQLQQADQLLAAHEDRIVDAEAVRGTVQQAIADLRSAMSTLRKALEPNQLKQLIDRTDIRSYATDLLGNWVSHWRSVDVQLNEAMEKWSVRRLARVDRDILRLAMLEIIYMDVPKRVAIDEAIEMAKRYSDEDGYRFINGVLRRTTDKLETSSDTAAPAETVPSEEADSSTALATEPEDSPKPELQQQTSEKKILEAKTSETETPEAKVSEEKTEEYSQGQTFAAPKLKQKAHPAPE